MITEPMQTPLTRAPAAPSDQGSTEELVQRARGGDRDAYGSLFERFHDEIYRFATRRLGDPHAGQDVAAQTFADAFAALGRFRWTGSPFEAWLYTIARRRVIDQLRRIPPLDPGPDGAADDHADALARTLDLRAAIARLPGAERDVIELRFMEDLDVEATARRLGKTPGAVRVTQHRALRRLRETMPEGTI